MVAGTGNDFQVAIIGGGPAGLSAALTLSRSMIRTLVIDADSPARNSASPFVASLAGMDRQTPEDVRNAIRKNISAYPYAQFATGKVETLRKSDNGFELKRTDGTINTAELVLLASGMVDEFPPLEHLQTYWGHSIINCPFCHGIEWKDARWGIYADRPEVLAAAEIYRNWSADLVYFVGPGAGMDENRQHILEGLDIQIERELPKSVTGSQKALTQAVMADGRKIELDCLLVYPRQSLPELTAGLGLDLTDAGCVQVDEGFRSSLPGVYAAGDLIYQGHQNTPTALHMGNMAAASMVMDLCFATG